MVNRRFRLTDRRRHVMLARGRMATGASGAQIGALDKFEETNLVS